MSNYKILNSKNVFTITLIVITLTIISVWLFGLGDHRSFFKNSLLSTTLLSAAFFLFISVGLFRGAKFKDNLGKITDDFVAYYRFCTQLSILGFWSNFMVNYFNLYRNALLDLF